MSTNLDKIKRSRQAEGRTETARDIGETTGYGIITRHLFCDLKLLANALLLQGIQQNTSTLKSMFRDTQGYAS